MFAFQSSLLVVLGLVVGSFLTCVSWRLPRGQSFWQGRSRCPKCKKVIPFFCNIPLFSYIFLQARCFYCRKKISVRYPLIEGAAALLFLFSGAFFYLIQSNLPWMGALGVFALPFWLFLAALFLLILIIDWEDQIIPDRLVYLGLIVCLVAILLSGQEIFFLNLLAGLLAAAFLLSVYLATQGRGMGLGDVKLVLLLGLVLGPKGVLISLFLAFLTGAVVGIILILAGRGRWKQKIAFGPFLVLGFVLVSFLGERLISFLY